MKKKRTLNSIVDRETHLSRPLERDELRGWRSNLGWTQEEAATWLGISPHTYRSWESSHANRRKPSHVIGIRLRMEMAIRKGT
jgi:DNA-binding XRE family transcriptional regulator